MSTQTRVENGKKKTRKPRPVSPVEAGVAETRAELEHALP